MSSFKNINSGIRSVDQFGIDDDDVITLNDQEDVIKIKGRRYRKANMSTQDWVYHWILTLRGFKKVYLHSKGWYCECKKHQCPMDCPDSQ